MKPDQYQKSNENGQRVWEALMSQMAEGQGFFHAMFVSFRNFCRKNILYFLIFGLIGGGIAAACWFFQPKVYEAEMTVSYVHYEKKIYADMLVKLNNVLVSGNKAVASAMLDMPEEMIGKIQSVSSFNIEREPLVEDLSTEKLPFYIVARVTDTDVLSALETALINYLDATDFIQERLRFMKEKNERELAFLEQRLAIADSLSRLLDLGSETANDEKTVTRMELLGETIAIHTRIQDTKGLLEFNVNIEILDGFAASNSPVGKGLKSYIIFGFLIGLALRFLVVLFA